MAYYFNGSVNELGISVSRVIRAYRVDTGILVGETTSSGANGDFTLETTYSGAHYIVCLDDYSDEKIYNDLIYGNMYPIT